MHGHNDENNKKIEVLFELKLKQVQHFGDFILSRLQLPCSEAAVQQPPLLGRKVLV